MVPHSKIGTRFMCHLIQVVIMKLVAAFGTSSKQEDQSVPRATIYAVLAARLSSLFRLSSA